MANIPKMMSVREVAKTGILPETAIRRLLKQGKIPAVYSGTKAYINDRLCEMLDSMEIA